jgi:hypothetical protein
MSTTWRTLKTDYDPGHWKPDSLVLAQFVLRLTAVIIVGVLTAALIISANP